ncbi:MAG: hypothetical protein V4664_01095 [Patescibacteria group bacterium]
MNIIKRDNQRAVIHLSRVSGSDVFLVRALVFTQIYNGSYTSHLIGIKRINAEEAADLRKKTNTLAQYSITLIDADATAAEIIVATTLLGISKPTVSNDAVEKAIDVIPSPYASKVEILAAFLTSQKTRAPTR